MYNNQIIKWITYENELIWDKSWSLSFFQSESFNIEASNAQCGNFSFLVIHVLCEINLESHLCHLSPACCSFGKFQPQKSAKINKDLNSKPLNVLKWQILLWFHANSEWKKNHEISTLWNVTTLKSTYYPVLSLLRNVISRKIGSK